MGLGGSVNWPFLCSLQRVAVLLRALVRPWVVGKVAARPPCARRPPRARSPRRRSSSRRRRGAAAQGRGCPPGCTAWAARARAPCRAWSRGCSSSGGLQRHAFWCWIPRIFDTQGSSVPSCSIHAVVDNADHAVRKHAYGTRAGRKRHLVFEDAVDRLFKRSAMLPYKRGKAVRHPGGVRFPDFRWAYAAFDADFEVDERAHSGYPIVKELQRIRDLLRVNGKPLHQFRYNPGGLSAERAAVDAMWKVLANSGGRVRAARDQGYDAIITLINYPLRRANQLIAAAAAAGMRLLWEHVHM